MTTSEAETGQVGLCLSCLWLRRVRSTRGREFYLCGRSVKDPQFPKYPVLPVVTCPGFENVDPGTGGSTTSE